MASCPLCGGVLSAVQVEAAFHLVQCGARCLQESGATVVAGHSGSPGATTVRSVGALGKAKEEENEDENEEEKIEKNEDEELGTPKRKRSSPGRAAAKKTKKDDEDEEEEEEDLTPKTSRNAKKGSASPAAAKRASFASVEEYDAFLLSEKQGRFVRVGSWTGMSKGILHRFALAPSLVVLCAVGLACVVVCVC